MSAVEGLTSQAYILSDNADIIKREAYAKTYQRRYHFRRGLNVYKEGDILNNASNLYL